MSQIFITGGTGFFGKSILDYRLRHPDFLADDSITLLSRDPGRFIKRYPRLAKQPGVAFRQGDVRSFDFGKRSYDTILHMATDAVTTLADDEMTSVIVDGTQHVIDFAKSCGAAKLMLTSSGAVYGPQTAPVSEDTPCNPTTAYGKGKLRAEKLCITSGIPTYLPRCFAFVGPYLSRTIHFAIGNFIQNCIDRQPIVLTGDGTPLRSYLYADDLVKALFTILERGEANRLYNVGSPEALSIKALAEVVRETLGADNKIIIQCPPTNSPSSVYVPDTTRLETELNFKKTISLIEAIKLSASA